jgi:hypothetical protein
MQIVFSNGDTVDLILNQTPLVSIYQKTYKHLQHINIPFRDWDNPFYFSNITHQELVEKLILYASKVHVPIDRERCLTQDQNYFNFIHKIFEENYDGNPDWLNFHEHLHMCETTHVQSLKILRIDYREKFGIFQTPFDNRFLKSATTKIKAGDVFVQWSELGKTPYGYWNTNEPNDLDQMRNLIKPWATFIPKIEVAIDDYDTMENKKISEFEPWWKQYSKELCKHWNIPSWNTNDIFSVLVFGRVQNFEEMLTKLQNNQTPIKVAM